MSHVSKSIISKIKEGKIKPTPKWVFLLKHSVVWGLFGFSVLLGSIAVSIIFFQYCDADWNVYSQMNDSILEFVLLALPYFWLLLMVGFLALAHYNFRHTKTGYRYNVFVILGLSLLTSLLLGSALHASGFSEKLENVFQQIPHYEKLNVGKRILWQRPGKGLLAGTIVQIEDKKVLILQDLKQQSWWVDIERARSRPNFIPVVQMKVKMVGRRVSPGNFDADLIGPWRTGDLKRLQLLKETLEK